MMVAAILAAALAFSQEDAAFAMTTTSSFVESCASRDAGTAGGLRAGHWLLDHASMTGADVRRDFFSAATPVGKRQFLNLYSEFESDPTSRWVVVVSHYDTKPGVGCPGANDGASTSALLVSLANVLANWTEPHGNVMLVWTDSEECIGATYTENDGLQGSRRAVEYLKGKNREVQAVICLDMLGDRELKISVPANGTPALAKIAVCAARKIGEPELVVRSEEMVRDDHVAFLAAGYKAIDLIDFDYGPDNSWWHTKDDTCDKLAVESFLKTGRLVCEMLNILL